MMISQECLPEGERFEQFKKLAAGAKTNGSLIVGQITHPGRQVKFSLSPEAVSASDVQLGKAINTDIHHRLSAGRASC